MHDPASQLPLAFRFEKKPNVIMGLTWPECTYAACASGFTALVFGLILGGLIGKWMLALPIFLAGGVLMFVVIGRFMQMYKHNRPEGYYQQKLYGVLQRVKIGNYYIVKSGYRDPRRVRDTSRLRPRQQARR